MYPYRVSLARPYWTGAAYRAILRALFSGRISDGPELDRLRSAILEQLGVEDAILCGSGSFALEVVLRACGVAQGDEVIIPTFCCTAVVPPILAVGAFPVLADIGDELNLTVETVKAALTEKTKAIIVPHLFGNPADIDAIVDLARGKNIRVIDDAAQALGATIDGRPVGGFGNAGILSFGAEKVCSGLGGGVGVSKKEGMFGDIDLWFPGRFRTLRGLLSALFWRRWRRWTYPAEALFAQSNPDAPPDPYRQETMANLSAAVALTLMQTLRENVAARRERVRDYQKFLGGEERLQLIPHRSGSACLTQIVRVVPRGRGDDSAARVIAALRRAGFEVHGSYVPIHLLSAYEKFARIPLPNAERVWADLVELPCEPDVSFDDVQRIASFVKRLVHSLATKVGA
ncbi:MAG TPA: DegT/DnrJ/EryC1/StrS family aminotransferase [Candidatus Binatia bacterium]